MPHFRPYVFAWVTAALLLAPQLHAAETTWQQTLAEAKGQHVYFNAWGGTTQITDASQGDIYSDGAGNYYVYNIYNPAPGVASKPSPGNLAGWYLLP